jgi:CBS domain-containing protein
MNEPWAADPLSNGSIAAVETIENAVTVDLIATFEPQLVCCATTDAIVELLADHNYVPFDYLPVRSGDRIVGLLSLGKLRAASIDPGLTAEGAMILLDQSILIASDSGLLRYIEEAETSPCRLVLRHTQIAGIVTISDLQKLAVRPALFVLVTHLELLMAASIRPLPKSTGQRLAHTARRSARARRGRVAETESRRVGDRPHCGYAVRGQATNPS